MRIENKDEVTRICFSSAEYRETAKIVFSGLLLFAGLPLIWWGLGNDVPSGYWMNIILFFSFLGIVAFFFGGFEKRIEIHPERIYVKNSIFLPEYEYPVNKKMVVLFENYPEIQLVFPREFWRISLGYENETFELIREMNDHFTMKKIVKLLCQKLDIPLADYTYYDQLDLVMYMKPEYLSLPFAWRAVKYPDLLTVGEVPPDKTVYEDLISSKKRIYKWTAFTGELMIRYLLYALIGVSVIALNIVSTRPDAMLSLPFLYEDRVLYYFVLLGILGSLTYYSSTRKKLTLEEGEITYISRALGFEIENKAIPLSQLWEVRIKPWPGGFVLFIVGEDQCMEIVTHHRGLHDFAHLLWLTGRIQDFLLNNRDPDLRPECFCSHHQHSDPEENSDMDSQEPEN